MVDCPYESRLDAYFDGELGQDAAREVAGHVGGCADCGRYVAELGDMSRLFGQRPRPRDITPSELSRLHRAVDRVYSQPLLRLAVAVSAVAASILIISLAWLSVLSSPRTVDVVVSPVVEEPTWERLAAGEGPALIPGDKQTGMADNATINWMLDGTRQPGTEKEHEE